MSAQAIAGDIMSTLAIAGGIMSATGAIAQGNAARAAGEYNAQLAEQNAVLAQQQAAEEERRFRVGANKRLGAMRAAYSASGVTMEGSPMDVMEESMRTSEIDALTIRQGGRASASAYQSEAQLARMGGRTRQQAGYLSASSELLRGGTDYYRMKST
jgi:hypothetical protein